MKNNEYSEEEIEELLKQIPFDKLKMHMKLRQMTEYKTSMFSFCVCGCPPKCWWCGK